MRTRITLLSAIAFLSFFASANAQIIDSAQWPFPYPLVLAYSLSGNYTYYGQETKALPEVDYNSNYFGWVNVTAIDSSEWLLSNQNEANQPDGGDEANLTLILDTANRIIIQLGFDCAFSGGLYEVHDESTITLHQLHYDRSNITCSDNDLWRHVSQAGFEFNDYDANNGGYFAYSLDSIDGFDFYGVKLIPGFSFPTKIQFGSSTLDSARDTTIMLHNVSDTVLQIYNYTLQSIDSGFSFVDTSLHIIPAGDSGTITVRFAPQKVRFYSGSIQIVTDEPYAPAYAIQLLGSAEASGVMQSGSVDSNFITSLVSEEGKLLLELSSSYSSARFDVFDILGHRRASMNQSLNAGENFVSLNDLIGTSGEYILRVQSGNEVQSLKFVMAP